MCQQSLINYLETNIDVPVGDIGTFIQHGELAQQITSRADVDEKYLPASIKKNYNKINDLLKNIKIVDPAVGTNRWKKYKIEQFPIKKAATEQKKAFIQLVDQILAITKDADYFENPDKQTKVKKLEKQIDQLVYKLYDLTPEEIEIVEGFNKGK